MNTNGIDQVLAMLRSTAAEAASKPAEAGATEGNDFASVLQKSIEQVNQTQQTAEHMAEKFAAGDSNQNLHEVMLALQKANVSFQEMVQVRNKLVTAYHDVMNMQV